jgi:hypothetical protein
MKPQTAVDDFAAILASAQDPQPIEEETPMVTEQDLPRLFTLSQSVAYHEKHVEQRREFDERATKLEAAIAELESHGR